MKKTLAYTLFTLLFISCGGNAETEEESSEQVDWEAHLESKKDDLKAWHDEINQIPKKLIAQDEFPEKADMNFDFSPVKGTHSGNASVNPDFNAIFLSRYALDKEVPEGMKYDYFNCSIYEIVGALLSGDDMPLRAGIPKKDDDRFPSAAVAYMDAIDQVEYVFLADVKHWYRGSIVAYGQTATLTPGMMKGEMYIYDMKNSQIIEWNLFSVTGFESVSYSYSENGGSDAPQKAADKSLDDENQDYYTEAIIDQFAPNNNWYPDR